MNNINFILSIIVVLMLITVWCTLGYIINTMFNCRNRSNMFIIVLWPVVGIVMFVRCFPKHFEEFINIVFKGENK